MNVLQTTDHTLVLCLHSLNKHTADCNLLQCKGLSNKLLATHTPNKSIRCTDPTTAMMLSGPSCQHTRAERASVSWLTCCVHALMDGTGLRCPGQPRMQSALSCLDIEDNRGFANWLTVLSFHLQVEQAHRCPQQPKRRPLQADEASKERHACSEIPRKQEPGHPTGHRRSSHAAAAVHTSAAWQLTFRGGGPLGPFQ